MYLLLIVLSALAFIAIVILDRQKKTDESLVLDILETLSKKFSQASITIAAYIPGTPIRRMQVESAGVTLNYEWPVGENTLGLPRVLSGTMTDIIQFRGHAFFSASFTLALGEEKGRLHREGLSYQITLRRKGAPPFNGEGIIGTKNLATSMHRFYFEGVIARVGGQK